MQFYNTCAFPFNLDGVKSKECYSSSSHWVSHSKSAGKFRHGLKFSPVDIEDDETLNLDKKTSISGQAVNPNVCCQAGIFPVFKVIFGSKTP